MKIWLVVFTNSNDPMQKVYIAGGHSTEEAAKKSIQELDKDSENKAHLLAVNIDERQPPIVVGIAQSVTMQECKKNTPNG